MSALHKSLLEQVGRYVPEALQNEPWLKEFVTALSKSYHAFDKNINDQTKNTGDGDFSIEKISEALRQIQGEQKIEPASGNEGPGLIAELISIEIRKRKETEDNLTRTLQLLVTLVSSLHSAILVVDENGKILFTNENFCNLFRLDKSVYELRGQVCTEQMKRSGPLFKDPERFAENASQIVTRQKAIYGEELEMTDGKILARDYVPIVINGEYKGHLWEFTDITERKVAEKKLVELTNMQEAILNGTDYAIIFTDLSGIIKAFNRGAEKMLGYSAGELINQHDPSLIHDDAEVLQRAAELSEEFGRPIEPGIDVFTLKSRSGKPESREWTYIRKDGSRLTVQLSVSAILNSSGVIIGYLGIAQDISQQKKVQRALAESEERYRNIVEHSTDIIYKTNAPGNFIFVNPIAERITGYSQQELLTMHFSDLVQEEHRENVVEFYLKQFTEKKSTTYLEFPIKTKQGNIIWIGQSVQLTNVDHNIEFIALAIDITERINYEKTILLQKEKYQNIIANMNLGLLEVDKQEIIQYANRGFVNISGFSLDELVGKDAAKLLAMDNMGILKSKLEARARGISDMYEIQVKNKHGELRWWMISGAPNYDNKGNMTGSIGIHLDITEQKKLEAQLEVEKERAEASSRAKATFLANMSHEIRTPLNGIIGMIRELSYENLPEKQRKYVHTASIASQHLLSVLNNVLDISKIEAGELNLDKHHFSLRDIIKDVKSIMSVKAKEKGLLLSVDTHHLKDAVYVGDAARIRQILLNLVGNSIKFTSEGGIFLECRIEAVNEQTHRLSFFVEDSGIGIDQKYQADLFRKFSQEDSSISRRYGGTGLGMAITRELIQLMHGHINVVSEKGKGTVIEFSFELPVGDPKKVDPKDLKPMLAGDVSAAKILLVEDNEFNRVVARNTLERFGCEVEEAENGEVAVSLLKKNKYHMVLMDLQMPVLDGFEATKIIRNQLKLHTPVIALTANAFKSELEQCLAAGMNDYITKPYDEEKLIAAIYRLLNIDSNYPPLAESEDIAGKSTTNKLYDLSMLIKIAGNEASYLKKMISIFTEQAILSVNQLREAYQNKDLKTIYQVSHRIKPSIDGMGIISLKNVVREVEEMARQQNDAAPLKEQIEVICEVLMLVVEQLRDEKY